jgi:hypothetical protein
MKIIISALLVLLTQPLFSQSFFPDFRNKKESLLKVREKDIRADVVTFSLTGIEENIHQDPLPKLPLTGFDETYVQYEGSNIHYMQFVSNTIKVRVTTDDFDSTKSKITRSMGRVVKINNRPYYGNYGFTPTSYIKEVLVMVNKDTIAIPAAAYADLFNLKLSYTDKKGTERSKNGVFLSADKRKIYIYLFCKDNSGSYEVTWVIQDKQYLRRVLDYGILN